MTYTILGYCKRTGQVGVGITTYSLNVGALCSRVEAGVGAISSQAFVNLDLRALGINLLRQGYPSNQIIEIMKSSDPNINFRQLLVLDSQGRGAGFTGVQTRQWTGHKTGLDFVAAGNVLCGEQVVNAMAETFLSNEKLSLDERLLCSIEAGRDAGGQVGSKGHLPERSAALVVRGHTPVEELDLRVDFDLEAVEKLRLVHEEWKPYRDFHNLRHVDPANAPSQEVFVHELLVKHKLV